MTTTHAGRSALEVLDAGRTQVEPALRTAVDSLPPPIRDVAGYHFGWLDADGRPAADFGGKVVRPTLTLLSAAAVGGCPADAVAAAVAVELVHNFSLLHDDVMDGDRTRRHRPTVWAVFGTASAILVGDSLLTLAMDVLARTGHPRATRAVRTLGSAVQELVEGQVADLAFEQRTDVTLDECLRMAEAKTGALLGGACALGALLGGGADADVAGLDRFGRDLGLAYQLVDDLLGIWGDPAATGKPVCNDLRSRKKSLPVVVALTSGTAAGRALDAVYSTDRELSDAELADAARLVEAAGGRVWCRQRADELLGRARLPADGAPGAVADLHTVARLVADRTR